MRNIFIAIIFILFVNFTMHLGAYDGTIVSENISYGRTMDIDNTINEIYGEYDECCNNPESED